MSISVVVVVVVVRTSVHGMSWVGHHDVQMPCTISDDDDDTHDDDNDNMLGNHVHHPAPQTSYPRLPDFLY